MLSVLGTIQCPVGSPTLNSILNRYGLKATERSSFEFEVTSMTNHSDPALERDLFGLALRKMEMARADGALPVWRQLS